MLAPSASTSAWTVLVLRLNGVLSLWISAPTGSHQHTHTQPSRPLLPSPGNPASSKHRCGSPVSHSHHRLRPQRGVQQRSLHPRVRRGAGPGHRQLLLRQRDWHRDSRHQLPGLWFGTPYLLCKLSLTLLCLFAVLKIYGPLAEGFDVTLRPSANDTTWRLLSGPDLASATQVALVPDVTYVHIAGES